MMFIFNPESKNSKSNIFFSGGHGNSLFSLLMVLRLHTVESSAPAELPKGTEAGGVEIEANLSASPRTTLLSSAIYRPSA